MTSPSVVSGDGVAAASGRSADSSGIRAALDIPAVIAAVVSFGLLCGIAWPMLTWWYWEYTRPESYYGHAFLIPPLIAVMLWHRRDALRAVQIAPCFGALGLVIPASLLLIYAIKIEMEAIMSLAFLLSLIGGIWLVMGTRWLRTAAVPLLFLLGMAPLPGPVLNDLTLNMQGLSTTGAAHILQIIGLHPVHIGNFIKLDSFTLNVDVPCSGFKLLLRLLTFSAAFAYLSETTLSRRWTIFLFSLPLSLFINSLRIALIGVVGECLGTSAALVFHDWSGLITTILCMAVLMGFARSLGCRRFAGQPIF